MYQMSQYSVNMLATLLYRDILAYLDLEQKGDVLYETESKQPASGDR